MRRASGKANASRRAHKAGKGVHLLGLMGLMEREDTAIEISTAFHDEGNIEFQVIARLLAQVRQAKAESLFPLTVVIVAGIDGNFLGLNCALCCQIPSVQSEEQMNPEQKKGNILRLKGRRDGLQPCLCKKWGLIEISSKGKT